MVDGWHAHRTCVKSINGLREDSRQSSIEEEKHFHVGVQYIVFKYEFPFTYPVLVGVAPKQFQKNYCKN